MKKSILFMVINMNIGGTEKSLLSMLSEIDETKYDVTVLMLEEQGGFLKEIPEWVSVKYINRYEEVKGILNNPLHFYFMKLLKEFKLLKAIIIIYLYLLSKINNEQSCVFKYVLKKYPSLEKEYDIAVAFAGPMDFISYFVVNRVRAKKKMQWIHFDITKIGFNEKFAKKVYDKFDNIFVVSNEAKNKLIDKIPILKDKTEVFYNIVSSNMITNMANKETSFDDKFDGVRLLTVGRLSKEKGQHLTIPVLSRLRTEGYNVKWYCIGDGNAKKEYEQMIKEYDLKEDYILLGAKSNPYPFMRDCDIYVQPSIHEGYCITLAEARCFKNPIVSTDFTGAREQIEHNHCGLITDISEDGLYTKIKELLDNKNLREEIIFNLKKHNVDTSKEIEKLYACIDNNLSNRGGDSEKDIIHG